MLITKTVIMKWSPNNKKYYESLGYKYTKMRDEFEVKVEDLNKHSDYKVDCICDNCKCNMHIKYSNYNRTVKENGKTYCNNCAKKLYGGKNIQKTKLKNSKSFYDWCVENSRQDVLDRWDYKLNDCSPKDISYKTGKKCWFKCDKHQEHKSELKLIRFFTSGKEGNINCNQCNSFAQWCIDNNRQYVLDRWDYELNNCSPWDISYGSGKKYWFKCLTHTEHKSELKEIDVFTSGREGIMCCKQCNSMAQWFIDNNLDINDYWDFEKNTVDPWEISCGSKKKIWIKCQEKDYHSSYKITCNDFARRNRRCPYCSGRNGRVHIKDSLGQYIIDNYSEEFLYIWSDKNKKTPFEYFPKSSKKAWWKCPDELHEDFLRDCNTSVKYKFRCPKCVEEMNNSIIEEKTKIYLEELGYKVLTEHKCTIRPINPKTGHPLPYDNEIILENEKHLIIEVHGEQHYKIDGLYNRTKEQLHYQQVKDRYKRIKCKQVNYFYLELPYWTFNKKETYKRMIDDKINEILNISKTS